MSAPTVIPAATWQQIRVGYMQGATFTALAEEFGVSSTTIGRRAGRELWAYHRRLLRAEKMARREVAEAEFLRRQGIEVARALLRCCRDRRITDAQFAAEVSEADSALGWIHHALFWKASALRDLEDARAGRPERHGSALEELSGASYDRVGKWPERSDAGPRKPFPWERRRQSRSRAA